MDFSQELSISSMLNHPSILKFYGYSPVDLKNKPKLSMIFENVTNKTLSYILFPEKEKEENNNNYIIYIRRYSKINNYLWNCLRNAIFTLA